VHFRVSAYATLRKVLMTPAERRRQTAACEEICAVASKAAPHEEHFDCDAIHVEIEDIESLPDLRPLLKESLKLPYDVLKAELTFTVDESKVDISTSDPVNHPITQELRKSLVLHQACSVTTDFLRDLALAANIAKPGSVHITNIISMTKEGGAFPTGGALHSLGDALQRAIDLKWPRLRELPVAEVWAWLEGLRVSTQPGAKRIRRAIAALTRLLFESARDEDRLALIWALAGLESLYGESSTASKSQILKKSEALLGPRVENKKKFSWMYDYRSRLLHGDIDINPKYATRWFESSDEFDEETFECQALATSILLSTMQELCVNNSHQLDFELRPRLGRDT
jgi:hypothetical protein